MLAALVLLLLVGTTAATACKGSSSVGPGTGADDDPSRANGRAGEGSSSGGGNGVSWSHVQRYWIAQDSDPRYPDTQYLVAMGQAQYQGPGSYEDAEQNGRQRLAAFFETTIQSEFQRYQDQIVRSGDNLPTEVRGETFTRSNLRAIVEEAVPGADVTDRKLDPDGETAFVLVVIDRRIYADNLKVQIDELKSRIRSSLGQARTHRERGRYLGALRGYSPIIAWHQELVALIQKYNLVKPPGYPSITVDFDIDEILEEMVDVALRLTFAFKVEARAYDEHGSPMELDLDAEGELIRQLGDQGIEVLISRSTRAFREASVAEIREMSIDEVRELLGAEVAVNYVVTGTIEIHYSSTTETARGAMLRFIPEYRLEVIELRTNDTNVLADPVGRSQGAGLTAAQGARSALLDVCRQIAKELAESFTTG